MSAQPGSAVADQINAAVGETRDMVATLLPAARNLPAQKHAPPWVEQLFDQLTGPRQRRCAHLARRPVQPWLTAAWDGFWRCRPCAASHHEAQMAGILAGRIGVDPVEDRTCDRCRRHLAPSEPFTPTTLRNGIWILTAALCPPCTADAVATGGHLLQAGRR